MSWGLGTALGVAGLTAQGACAYGLRHAAWGLLARLLAVWLGVAGVGGMLLGVLPWRPGSSLGALWTCLGLASLGAGFVAALWARRLPHVELTLGLLPVADLLGVALWRGLLADDGNRAAALCRALLLVPALYALCAYFGASLGYLARSGGLRWGGFEQAIGRRFLLSKASPVLSTVTTISVVGVCLGVWLVLVSLAVLAGFENDLQRKIIGANAHLVVQQAQGRPFSLPAALDRARRRLRHDAATGIVDSAPFLQGEVAIASDSQYTGAMLFGVDPQQTAPVLTVLQNLRHGSVAPLQAEMAAKRPRPVAPAGGGGAVGFAPPAPLRGIVLGKELARGLAVGVGDRIRLISPTLEVLSPVGPAPKSLGFEVVGIFSSDMYEYDARYVYVSLAAARHFLELQDDVVSGLQVACQDPEHTAAASAALLGAAEAPPPGGLRSLDWRQRNQTLFQALQLEKVVAFVVLVFIILVASFSIVNTLTMSVIEKRREIAILKTMGAHDCSVLQIFLFQGLLVGGFGTVFGGLLGVGSCKLLARFGFWIPGDVYYIDSLPVLVNGRDVALVSLAALLIVWNFSVFPSLRGAQMTPVEGLRDA